MTHKPERDARGCITTGMRLNPNGRPTKDRSANAALIKAANARIKVTENGQTRKVRKIDAAATQLVNQAATGDFRAAKAVLDMTAKAQSQPNQASATPAPLPQSDRDIVDRYLANYLTFLASAEP